MEIGPDDACPLHGEETKFGTCECRNKTFDHFPDQYDADGSLIPTFAVFRGDGTACVVATDKELRVFCHPALDMGELAAWLEAPPDTLKPASVQTVHNKLEGIMEKLSWKVLLLTNGRTGAYKFLVNRDAGASHEDLKDVLNAVWHRTQ